MPKVNMHEAKTSLSKLVEAIESGVEQEIILARNGKPVARIVPLEALVVDTSKRLGIAEGPLGVDSQAFEVLDNEIWKGFYENRRKWDAPLPPRFGLAKGKYPKFSAEEFDALDAEVAQLFYGKEPALPVKK